MIRLDCYKYKTPENLLVILSDYMEKHKINDVSDFYVLYPNYLKVSGSNLSIEERVEYIEVINTEEIVIIYKLLESRDTSYVYFSVLNTVGDLKDNRNIFSKLWKYCSYVTLSQQLSTMLDYFTGILGGITILISWCIALKANVVLSNYWPIFIPVIIGAFIIFIFYIGSLLNEEYYKSHQKSDYSYLSYLLSEIKLGNFGEINLKPELFNLIRKKRF